MILTIEIDIKKETPDLIDKALGRIYTIDGVEDVRVIESGIEELEQENRLLRARNERLEQSERVQWGVDWNKDGSCASIIKRTPGGGIEVVAVEYGPQRTWPALMRGVRVEGDTVVITVKGGNEAARELCGALIEEMSRG